MSRAYNARRKARRLAKVAAEPPRRERRESRKRRLMTLLPVLLIAAILTAVAVVGSGASEGISKQQVRREVAELLSGVPQRGPMLGSPEAPITVWVYADLECPTVKLFVENYLPSFVDGWVRTRVVRIGYRSLETDTGDESTFFQQDVAALAAGRQNKMWDFVLTFLRQQGEVQTDYADEEFIAGIASQVPGMKPSQWHRDRADASLSKQVAAGLYSARMHQFNSTPSFFVSYGNRRGDRPADAVDWASMKREVESTLQRNVDALQAETEEDFPTLKFPKSN